MAARRKKAAKKKAAKKKAAAKPLAKVAVRKKTSVDGAGLVEVANTTSRMLTINMKPGRVIQRIRLHPGINRVDPELWAEAIKLEWVQANLDDGALVLDTNARKRAKGVTKQAGKELVDDLQKQADKAKAALADEVDVEEEAEEEEESEE